MPRCRCRAHKGASVGSEERSAGMSGSQGLDVAKCHGMESTLEKTGRNVRSSYHAQ